MKEVKEFLKLAADSMKNETLNQLLESDVEYQKKAGEEKQALEAVGGLKLTEEEKEAVDIFIARKDELRYESNVNAYMAGILDGYEILKMFDLTKE